MTRKKNLNDTVRQVAAGTGGATASEGDRGRSRTSEDGGAWTAGPKSADATKETGEDPEEKAGEHGRTGTVLAGRIPAPVVNTAEAAGRTVAAAPRNVAVAASTTWRAAKHRRALATGGGAGVALLGAVTTLVVARRRARRRRGPLARLTGGRLGA